MGTSFQVVEVVGPHRFARSVRPAPGSQTGEVIVAPAFVGICGTDLELLAGTMPYLRTGDARFPMVLGHEWSGHVVDPNGSGLAVGTPVVGDPVIGCGWCPACRSGRPTRCADRAEIGVRRGRPGGLATRLSVPADHVYPIPRGLSLQHAVLAEPGVTAMAAVEATSAAGIPATTLVIGAGTIGLLAARFARDFGSSVTVLQRTAVRDPLARSMDLGSWVDAVGSLTGQAASERTFDAVIEASGDPDAVPRAIAFAAPGATVAIAGVYPAPSTVFATDLVLKEVTVVGILNGTGRFPKVLQALAGGVVDGDDIIDIVIPVDRIAEAFERASSPGRSRPKVLVDVRDWGDRPS